MNRLVLLVDIGPDPLPQITPANRAPINWAPPPKAAVVVPPPTDVEVKPGTDSITITWSASPLPGAEYVVWRAPDVRGAPGAWEIVTRTTDTRYTYTDTTGAVSWWKITVLVNGVSSGDSDGAPMAPVVPPTTAELILIQQRLDKETADRFEADAAESQARADAVADLAADLSAAAQLSVEGIAANATAIAKEANDRATALLNERLSWQAGVSQEAAIRENADESLAYAMSQVSAGSGTQFDSRKIWYFDATGDGWTGNGEPTVVDGWLRPADATSFPYLQSPDALEIDGGAYRFVKLRIKKVGNPAWAGLLQWTTTAAPVWSDTRSATALEPVWDSLGVATLDFQDVAWWPATLKQLRLQVGAAQSETDCFLLDWVAIGRPTPGAGVALVQQEASARIAADSAEAMQRDTLAVQLRGEYDGADVAGVSSGLIASERDARVTADEANASALQLIQVRLPAGDDGLATEASVLAEQQARVDGDSANAQATQLISARLPDGDGKVASVEALDSVTAKVEQTEQGLASMGERVTSLNAQFDGEHAGDDDWNAGEDDWNAGTVTVYTVIADGDHAQAKKVDTVTAEFGGFKAGVTEQIEAIADDVSAQAQQLVAVHTELKGKASADAVNQLSTQVQQNAEGITAVAQQIGSVKVEVEGKASAQVVQGMQAQVQQNAAGLSQVMAKAFLHLIADGGNGPLIGGMEIDNNGQVVNTRFLSHTLQILAPGADRGMEWRDGYLRVWNGSAQRIIGTGFGNGMEGLMDYFGPNVGPGAATKANAVMWMDSAGNAYWGGALAAGVLRNAVQTTTVVMTGTQLVCGPFSTNGRNKSVVISFSRRVQRIKSSYGTDGFVAGAGENTCTINVYRQVGNNAETFWTQLVARGGVNITNERDGPDYADSNWGGAVTINDGADGSLQRQYRAEIVGASEQEVRHQSGSFNSQSIEQSLSIVSVEI